MLVVIFLDPINDRLIRTFWTADVAGIDAFTAGDNEVGICTVNLCPVRDTEVPTLVEMDMACLWGWCAKCGNTWSASNWTNT